MFSHASYVLVRASGPSFAAHRAFGASNFSYLRAPAEGGGALRAAVGAFGGGAHCDPADAQGFPRTPEEPGPVYPAECRKLAEVLA